MEQNHENSDVMTAPVITKKVLPSAEDIMRKELGVDNSALDSILAAFNEISKEKTPKNAYENRATTKPVKKMSIAEIDKMIQSTHDEIANYQAAIETDRKQAEEWYAIYEAKVERATRNHENRKRDLYLTTNTLQGLEFLIETKKAEITQLEERIKNGDYVEETDETIQDKIHESAQLMYRLCKNASRDYKEYADRKIDQKINGNYPEGSNKLGYVQKIALAKTKLVELQEQKDLLLREQSMTPAEMQAKMSSDQDIQKQLNELFDGEKDLTDAIDQTTNNENRTEIDDLFA